METREGGIRNSGPHWLLRTTRSWKIVVNQFPYRSDLANVGVGTDMTVNKNSYEWNGLSLIDLPGYGTAKFPSETYFEQFDVPKGQTVHIAETRHRPAFASLPSTVYVLHRCVPEVRSQLERGKTLDDLRDEVKHDLARQVGQSHPILFTSCLTPEGLDDLQKAIHAATRIKQDRFARAAKAYSREFLEQKRAACRRFSTYVAAGASLGNMVALHGPPKWLRSQRWGQPLRRTPRIMCGISHSLETSYIWTQAPAVVPVAKELLQLVTKEGLLWFLGRFAGNLALAEAAKWVLYEGSAVAGGASFVLMQQLAFYVIDRCHELDLALLDTRVDGEAAMA